MLPPLHNAIDAPSIGSATIGGLTKAGPVTTAMVDAPAIINSGQFNKYKLLAKLTKGAMTQLFVAHLEGAADYRRYFAIKRILPSLQQSPEFRTLLIEEANVCSKLKHPNICQVFELCESEAGLFLVLEYLEGATISDLIRRCISTGRQLNLSITAGIISQACNGLHSAHEQLSDTRHPIVLAHSNITPGSLFVTTDGIVKILNFGITKAITYTSSSDDSTLFNKQDYMSPEQVKGEQADRRSDIYSLGIITWELLCGRRLFQQDRRRDSLTIDRPSTIRHTIPKELDDAVMCALEQNPANRFSTAEEFRKALTLALKQSGGLTPMCDIATLIRRSFARGLTEQATVLKQTSDQCTALQALEDLPKIPTLTINTSASPIDGTPLTDITVSMAPEDMDPDEPELETSVRQVPLKQLSRGSEVDFILESPQERPAEYPIPSMSSTPRQTTTQPQAAAQAPFEPDLNVQYPRLRMPWNTAREDLSRLRRHTVQEPEKHSIVLWGVLGLILLAVGLSLWLFLKKEDQSNQQQTNHSATTSIKSHPTPASPQSNKSENKKATSSKGATETQKNHLTKPKKSHRTVKSSDTPTLTKKSAGTGTVTILSSAKAIVYLYPRRKKIGTTPLIGYELPVGNHKIKLTRISNGKEKKYFFVKISKEQDSKHSFPNWK